MVLVTWPSSPTNRPDGAVETLVQTDCAERKGEGGIELATDEGASAGVDATDDPGVTDTGETVPDWGPSAGVELRLPHGVVRPRAFPQGRPIEFWLRTVPLSSLSKCTLDSSPGMIPLEERCAGSAREDCAGSCCTCARAANCKFAPLLRGGRERKRMDDAK